MVLLSLIKETLHRENPFERGHPVQLLLYLFNQFNQDSVKLLLHEIETILPPIPNESKQLIENAENIFHEAFKQYQYYQNATDEEKEYIGQEIKKKQKKNNKNNEHKQTELDDVKNENNNTNNTTEQWLDTEKFQLCDLSFRKATKLNPKCIKCYLKHIQFLFQCKKISQANEIFQKASRVVNDLKKSKTKTKPSKKNKNKNKKMNLVSVSNLNRIKTLITFHFSYLYYMNDDISNFNKYLQQCLDIEPHDIGIRCQFIVCLITQMEYEKAYTYLIETLSMLKEKQNSDEMDEIKIKHYRVICGIGAASIRSIFGIDYSMVTQHLQFVIENDESNIGIIHYCLSYSLYKNGKYDLSNDYYNKFVQYINKKKCDAIDTLKKRGKKTKTESDHDRDNIEMDPEQKDINEAASQLSMDFFKWHPNAHKNNMSEILDIMIDLIAVMIIISITYFIFGYKPHVGNNIMDWFFICVMLIISCVLCTPSLGILLIAVSLPPSNNTYDNDFNYLTFTTKWLCVSAGLLFIYRVVIAGEIPVQKWF